MPLSRGALLRKIWKNWGYLCIYIKVRHEWEKVETFQSMELNYLGSGGWEGERKCVKKRR